MRFKQTITEKVPSPAHRTGAIRVEIIFGASDWPAAGRWADDFRKSLAMQGPNYESVVVREEEAREAL